MTQLARHVNHFFPLELKGCGTKVVSLAMLSHTARKLSGMRHSVLCSQMRGQEFGQVEMSGLSPVLEEVWGRRWEDWSLWVTCIMGAKIIWVDTCSLTHVATGRGQAVLPSAWGVNAWLSTWPGLLTVWLWGHATSGASRTTSWECMAFPEPSRRSEGHFSAFYWCRANQLRFQVRGHLKALALTTLHSQVANRLNQ